MARRRQAPKSGWGGPEHPSKVRRLNALDRRRRKRAARYITPGKDAQ